MAYGWTGAKPVWIIPPGCNLPIPLPTWAGGSPDNEADLRSVLKEWVAKRQALAAARKTNARASDGLTTEQREAADAFAQSGKNETIPRMVNAEREPFSGAKAGYLRYRKVYAGSDSMLLSHAQPLESERVEAV